jgi:hypothetical protein
VRTSYTDFFKAGPAGGRLRRPSSAGGPPKQSNVAPDGSVHKLEDLRTTVVISASDLDTVQVVDRVLVLDVDCGSEATVLKSDAAPPSREPNSTGSLAASDFLGHVVDDGPRPGGEGTDAAAPPAAGCQRGKWSAWTGRMHRPSWGIAATPEQLHLRQAVPCRCPTVGRAGGREPSKSAVGADSHDSDTAR